ncbi:hypothetical protein HQQ82_00595 [Rathayibacter sp. VKM Ac-2856]|uniref:hypothetical protein n=1 Tax=unclassified Rathayibacter TaxID=2609250 RepID=UPI0015652BE2|nr:MULTISPECIES: hypothetical protein [unclassified Rathayibacter]NQX03294.1 hypothetical protein [Rathayibacter sp. VKM Ac-2858]NQX18462.1 hypothetical protein [Rathayibacter sp. VKM Ac-2856]
MRRPVIALLSAVALLLTLTGCARSDGSAEGARLADALRALPTVTGVEVETIEAPAFAASGSSTTVTAAIDDDATLADLMTVQDVLVEGEHPAVSGELLYRDFAVHGVVEPQQLETLVALTDLHPFSGEVIQGAEAPFVDVDGGLDGLRDALADTEPLAAEHRDVFLRVVAPAAEREVSGVRLDDEFLIGLLRDYSTVAGLERVEDDDDESEDALIVTLSDDSQRAAIEASIADADERGVLDYDVTLVV